ncbi:acireductone synthase [Flagellatimonas centrodinii]|uniref:acireductone synthase n=1 Tax=Flagellatimonas centrodinii TaxID=2806210 RepID=UPI001FEE228F|nr:acireductone synthase [Flagellatimonas centrodinii]ULQ45237.1 acireductone synthase [Flagellatimonas centrodinii]
MIRVVLVDIEGTTSSINFVHQTLFPYARQHLRAFLRAHADEAEVHRQLDEVERLENRELSLQDAADVLERWIDEDRKVTPLKALQGMIWAEGYRQGELQGHVYDDTPEALRAWKASGRALYVYSSGSVEAQKLIFGHTAVGDLTPLFSGYFDTRVGGKREAESYRQILKTLQCPPAAVLFLSDVGEELDAARAAGLKTCQVIRDDSTVPTADHPQVPDLLAVRLD